MEDLRDLRSMLNRLAKRVETDVRKLEVKMDKLMKLPDTMEIENLMKSMVWALDLGDKDLWLRLWSDDAQYIVQNEDIHLKGIKAIKEYAERILFASEKRRFTTLANTIIEISDDVATGKAYFIHYGYPINAETGEVSKERRLSEGMHYYKFRKDEDSAWKINRFEVYVHRREGGEAQSNG